TILIPGGLTAMLGFRFQTHGRVLRWLGRALMGLGFVWTLASLTVWVLGMFGLFVGYAQEAPIIPLMLMAYSAATTPWAYLAAKDENSGFVHAKFLSFGLQLSCMVAGIMICMSM